MKALIKVYKFLDLIIFYRVFTFWIHALNILTLFFLEEDLIERIG